MLQRCVFMGFQRETPEAHCGGVLLAHGGTAWGRCRGSSSCRILARCAARRQRSWDLMLVMGFGTMEALREYQQHPTHQAVDKRSASLRSLRWGSIGSSWRRRRDYFLSSANSMTRASVPKSPKI